MMQPIGVFDSGVGGLSVWREIVNQLPQENIIYFADNANCPYGTKTQDEIITLASKIVDFFISQNVKLVVVACNTATAAAIDYLRQNYSIPFIGMEPAVKPAALQTKTGCVGILATNGTLGGQLFKRTKDKYANDINVIVQPGTGLVELVEAGEYHSEKAKVLLKKYIDPMLLKHADHIVLGCTHYPFFRPLIDDIAGKGVKIIDPAPAVARQTKDVLGRIKSLEENSSRLYKFMCSGSAETLKEILTNAIKLDISNVEIIEHVKI